MVRYRIECWHCRHEVEADFAEPPKAERMKCSRCDMTWPRVEPIDRELPGWRDAFRD